MTLVACAQASQHRLRTPPKYSFGLDFLLRLRLVRPISSSIQVGQRITKAPPKRQTGPGEEVMRQRSVCRAPRDESATKRSADALPENRVTFLTHRINARLQQVSQPVILPCALDLPSGMADGRENEPLT